MVTACEQLDLVGFKLNREYRKLLKQLTLKTHVPIAPTNRLSVPPRNATYMKIGKFHSLGQAGWRKIGGPH